MLLRLAYLGITNTLVLLRLLPMSDRDKDAEILALRHQITVLQRQLHDSKVRFTPADRALLAALPQPLPRQVRDCHAAICGSPGVRFPWATPTSAVLPAQPGPVEVIGIDETRRGRPKWLFDEVAAQAWNTTLDRWHVGFCATCPTGRDCGDKSRAAMPRSSSSGCSTTAEWRDQVTYVAIDMCTIFKCAIRTALPHVQLVVDHFHVVQLANQTVTEIRRRVTVQVRSRSRRLGMLRAWQRARSDATVNVLSNPLRMLRSRRMSSPAG